MSAPDAGAVPAPGSDAALPHVHEWEPVYAWGSVYLQCWKDACGAWISFDLVAEILNKSGVIQYSGRKCYFCRQPEHFGPTERCGGTRRTTPRPDPLDNPTLRPRTAPAQQKAGTALNDPGSVGVTPPVQGDYTKPAPARCGCGHLVSDHRGGVCQHALCLCADMRPRTDAETGGRE